MTLAIDRSDNHRWRAADLQIRVLGRDVQVIGPCLLDRILSPADARAIALGLREAADKAEAPSVHSAGYYSQGKGNK